MFFNPYKFKKNMKRGAKNASCLIFSRDNSIPNTYHKHNTLNSPQKPRLFERIKLILLVISILGTVGLLIYHPFFSIQRISLIGLERINGYKLQETVKGIVNYYHLGILPKKNYFLVDLSEISEILKERYPVESVQIEKIFPNELKISIKEKISQIIYDNGQKYYYLDTFGQVIEPLRRVGEEEWQGTKTIVSTISTTTTSTPVLIEQVNRNHVPDVVKIKKEMGEYPIIYDKRVSLDTDKIILVPQTVQDTIEWFNQLNKFSNVKFDYLLITDTPEEGEIVTSKSWVIKVRFNGNVESNFAKLQYLLQNEKLDVNNLKYIDLRYPDKIFWQ